MARESSKGKLLEAGFHLVHERGYGGTSVRDVVNAAGAAQGSFTNHFASKEKFGLDVLELYFDKIQSVIDQTLRNEKLPPLKRLKAYFDIHIAAIAGYDSKRGCMFGNTSAEATDDNEALRLRVVEMLDDVTASVEYCLKAALKAGELPKGTRTKDLAGYITSSFEGAILLSKAYRSVAPIERFERILLASIVKG
ncbi:MAG: Transcriptional regulator, TetR family [Ramlibacter sp.]|nr:Transcriptional regulator, TetR family [Ramlibacter sp.]